MPLLVINGLGCTETGGREVLLSLLKAVPSQIKTIFIIPDTYCAKTPHNNASVWRLNKRFLAGFCRPIIEFIIGLLAALKIIDGVINLSCYGVCLSKKYIVYFHCPLLISSAKEGTGFHSGSNNFLKQLMIRSCIHGGAVFYVQTMHMKRALRAYCQRKRLPAPRIQIARPQIEYLTPCNPERHFDFQLFYPASNYAYKRVDLAVEAIKQLPIISDQTGLVVTTNGESTSRVSFVGQISRQRVSDIFAGSDVLLFTSEKETLGLPLLEALQFGLPAILPNAPYSREIYGQNAALYYNHPSEIPDLISEIMGSYPSFKLNALQRAKNEALGRLSWSEHWDEFLSDFSLEARHA